MKNTVKATECTLSARQALICAAVTGWAGDEPSSWPSPMPESDILEWGESYTKDISAEMFVSAFRILVADGLFFVVCHPIFKAPLYYCSLDARFLKELPDNICWVNQQYDKRYAIAMWEDCSCEYSEKHGTTWLLWGLCAGQGSQGPSDSPWGPCLGCECSWFTNGDKKCNWQHAFADVHRSGWPDLAFLHYVNREKCSLKDREVKALQIINIFKQAHPAFLWTDNITYQS